MGCEWRSGRVSLSRDQGDQSGVRRWRRGGSLLVWQGVIEGSRDGRYTVLVIWPRRSGGAEVHGTEVAAERRRHAAPGLDGSRATAFLGPTPGSSKISGDSTSRPRRRCCLLKGCEKRSQPGSHPRVTPDLDRIASGSHPARSRSGLFHGNLNRGPHTSGVREGPERTRIAL